MFAFFYSIFGFLFRILYSFVDNYGAALVIFTLFFRLVVLPANIKTQKGSAKQVRLQPKLKRIQERYKDYAPNERQQKIQEETNALYQREGYSAMTAGCLPLLFQLPILWGLYGVVRQPLTYVLQSPKGLVESLTRVAQNQLILTGNTAYAETTIITNIKDLIYKVPATASQYAADIEKIVNFDFTIFGMDLGAIPHFSYLTHFGSATHEQRMILLIPLLSFATSMLTSVLSLVRQKKNNPNGDKQQLMSMGCTMLMMPLMSLYFTFQFPVGMGMYWIFSNVLAFFQTLILGHVYSPNKLIARSMVEETIERRSYEKAIKKAAN